MLSPECQRFMDYARLDRRRSPNTLERYREVFESLCAIADPLTADVDDLQRWWESRFMLSGERGSEERSAATRANELFCLRSLYKWMTKYDLRPDDPTRRLDPPKIDNHVPRMMGQSEFDNLLGEWTHDALDLRKAFALGGYAGLRIGECATLDWRDIDHDARRMYVRGKGSKERPVPLSPVLLNYLLPETGGNVLTGGGKPYSPATLQRKVNRLLRRHGSERTFHDLRKRGASIALSKGASPAAVRTMFGWSSMETVARYAVVGDDELDRIAQMLT